VLPLNASSTANLRAVKSRLVILAMVAAVAVPAAVLADYTSGTYTGKTKVQKLAVSFKATQTRLSKLSIRVKFTCTDGDSFTTTLKDFGAQNIVAGRYDATFEGTTHASSYRHKGKITNSTAAGFLTGTRRYNANNDLDPNGAITCRTGTVRYSIKRKVPKKH
jgi:hypothetical protein